jgi:hypothetical protein
VTGREGIREEVRDWIHVVGRMVVYIVILTREVLFFTKREGCGDAGQILMFKFHKPSCE